MSKYLGPGERPSRRYIIVPNPAASDPAVSQHGPDRSGRRGFSSSGSSGRTIPAKTIYSPVIIRRWHNMPDTSRENFLLSSYDYRLPDGLIAQRAAEPRDSSRLMVSRADGSLEHRIFSDLPDYLEKGDVLVLNESKVIPARLQGNKPTGGKVEILLIERAGGNGERGGTGAADGAAPGADTGNGTWKCMLKGKNLKRGTIIELPGGASCRILEKGTGHENGILPVVEFDPKASADLHAFLDAHGEMPLPPYIKTRLHDRERYQTVYAHPGKRGSVAAPTAGLHFTPGLLAKIRAMGVHIARVTLHVSIGTFRPVRVDDVREHRMDEESCMLDRADADMMNNALDAGGRLFPVGTTTVKTLETILRNTGAPSPGENISKGAAKNERGFPRFEPWAGASDLFIYPPYEFLSPIHAMLTNFHLPGSTLLMLVSAFAGRERILDAYREAVARRYGFFSFGDAMLIYG